MLELTKRNIVELPFEVLAQAHWRSPEVESNDKYKKRSAENLDEKEYQRLDKIWRKRETLVNFSLDALFLSLSPAELANFTNLLCETNFNSAHLYNGHSSELKPIVGVPDLIVGDDNACILGEMKIQNGTRYKFEQFVKYQCFSTLCRAADNLANNLLHLLIVPNNSPKTFCTKYGKLWSPECIQNRLEFKENDTIFILSKFKESLEKLIKKPSIIKQKSLVEKLEREIIDANVNSLAPTLVFSWNEFIEIFDKWATEHNRNDLLDASQSLLKMSLGLSKV